MNKQSLIQKIKSITELNHDEKSELISLVNNTKKYGLVWEDKFEKIEEELLTNLPVLTEVTKRFIEGIPLAKKAEVENLFTQEVDNTIPENESYPNHILIEGDNLHALTALSFTHKGAIDLIYIDPPYNTGNKDFKYNDRFVDKEDCYRHSKWLSFMNKRLQIAKRLMSEKGVIFISIDDNENAQLKMLCDEVMGEKNFVSNVIWAAGKKNDSKHVSNSHEYILIYFKNIDLIKSNKIVWRERKDGIDSIYKTAEKLVRKNNGDFEKATIELKKWFKDLDNNDPIKAHSHYSMIDEKGVFFPDNISWPGGGGPKFQVLHPITKKPVATPSRGWVYSTPERMQEIIDEGKVHFGKDENSVPTLKSYLKDREYQVPYSLIYQDGRAATKRLMDMFGYAPFGNPKDENIISRFLKYSSNKNSIILDFFAGSGTSLHATMQLNAEDGGNRQCILVTNNENNICEEVTYERNKRVIQGYKNAKGEQISGLTNNNLRYYKCDYVPSAKTEINRRRLTEASTDLLKIKENCYIDITETNNYNNKQCRLFTNMNGKYMVVIYHSRKQHEVNDALCIFISKLTDLKGKVRLYAFSPEAEVLLEDFYDVRDKVTAVPLPDAIYNAYRATFKSMGLGKRKSTDEVTVKSQEEVVDLFNQNTTNE